MPDYSYKAADITGKVGSGVRFAADQARLRQLLRQEGLSLVWARPGTGLGLINALKNVQPGGMNRTQVIEFCTNIAVMLNAGVPLISCLDELRQEAENLYVKKVIADILDGLTAGDTLHQAMARRNKDFDILILNLIQIGEETGQLSQIFEHIAQHLKRLDDLIRNVRKALLYPSFVLISLLIAGFVFLTFVFPPLFTMLAEFKVELPKITRVVMAVSSSLKAFWIFWLAGGFSLIAGFFAMRQYQTTRYWLDWLGIRIPLVRKVLIQLHMTFFLRYMALMLSAGVDILRGIQLSANSVTNLEIRKRLLGIRRAIVDGSLFSQAMRTIDFVPNTVHRMVAVGESSGNLPEQMAYLADVYNEKLERVIAAALALLEPILIFTMAGLVLAMVMAVLVPLYNMVSTLSGGMGTGGF